tara:strand:+ start:864 stop:1118 length:255 start_codon:yes stop_codon:yes gene_type:complete
MSIEEQLKAINKRINMLGNVQMTLVDHFTANDNDLMRKLMAAMLSNDTFRDDFTTHLNNLNAPDDVKLFMTEVNEFMLSLKEEE